MQWCVPRTIELKVTIKSCPSIITLLDHLLFLVIFRYLVSRLMYSFQYQYPLLQLKYLSLLSLSKVLSCYSPSYFTP